MSHAANSTADVRPSPIAGEWYPGHPQELAASVERYLQRAVVPPLDGRIIGVLAPHAGHQYSGPVAGYAFSAVRGLTPDLVVLIGPSHHYYPADILATAHAAYGTPLGTVPVAHDLLQRLRDSLPIALVREDPEHSLEIELPFLQRVFGSFRLLPLTLMDQSLAMAEALAQAIVALVRDQNVLLVASSDLSHYYAADAARELDQRVLEAIADYDPAAVIAAEADGRKIACGHGAIATVMLAARALGADSAQVLHHATSGDVNHNRWRVVGYAAAVFYARQNA